MTERTKAEGAISVRRGASRTRWSAEEDDLVLALHGNTSPRQIAERLPGRSLAAVKWRLQHYFKVSLPGAPAWTKTEDYKLKYAWGHLSKINLERAFPGRTYTAIRTRARYLGIKADRPALDRRNRARRLQDADVWTPEDVGLLLQNKYNRKIWGALFPSRTTGAIESKLKKVIGFYGQEKAWADEEMQAAEIIIRQEQKLLKTRSVLALRQKLMKMRRFEKLRAEAVAAIEGACAWIGEAAVRQEVHAELFVQVLSKQVRISDLADASRRARTTVYGRRMYSLDAPVGDDSGRTWLDLLADDCERA